jgi:hypothetical protein
MKVREIARQSWTIVLNGIAAEVVCLVLQILLIMFHSYATGPSQSAEDYQQFARNIRHFAGPLITFAVVFLFAAKVCRKAELRLPLQGGFVGAIAAATGIAAMYLLRGNPELFLLLSVSISISAGYLGGVFVQNRRLHKLASVAQNSPA